MKKLILLIASVLMVNSSADEVWGRNSFEKTDANALLFYVIFGVDEVQLNLSKSKHNITGYPESIQILNYSKSGSDAQKEYIEGLYSDTLGRFLKDKSESLYKKTTDSDSVVLIQLEIEDQQDLEYLRNTLGIVQCILEQDAVSILDIQTASWYSAKEWTKKFFQPKKPQALEQVSVFYSKEESGYWVHTRGMRKFARPDISITAVPESALASAKASVDKLVTHLANGGDVENTVSLRQAELGDFTNGQIKGGLENLDFNNFYYEFTWK